MLFSKMYFFGAPIESTGPGMVSFLFGLDKTVMCEMQTKGQMALWPSDQDLQDIQNSTKYIWCNANFGYIMQGYKYFWKHNLALVVLLEGRMVDQVI